MNRKYRHMDKRFLFFTVCVILLLSGAYMLSNMLRNEQQKQIYIQSHKDSVIYWSSNPFYFYQLEYLSDTPCTFKIKIGHKLYNRGGRTQSFEDDNGIIGSMDSFVLDLTTLDLDVEKKFKTKPKRVGLTEEVCDNYGIEFDKFYPLGPIMYLPALICDDVVFRTGKWQSIIYTAYDKSKNKLDKLFVENSKLHKDMINVIDAEYYNPVRFFYYDEKEILYVFYRDQNALLVKAVG